MSRIVRTIASATVIAGAVLAAVPAHGAGIEPKASNAGPYGWAYNDNPTFVGTYTPSSNVRYNSTGGNVTITRSSKGVFDVRFAGMGGAYNPNIAGGRGTAFASGRFHNCKIESWGPDASDIVVRVACYISVGVLGQGTPVDTQFSVGYTNHILSKSFPNSFAYADKPAQTGYAPASNASYNFDAVKPMKVTRSNIGKYSVLFPERDASVSLAKVTAVGASNAMCHIASVANQGTGLIAKVQVACYDGTNGSPTDSAFAVVLGGKQNLFGAGSGVKDVAVKVFGSMPSGVAVQAASPSWAYNGSGFVAASAIGVTRSNIGQYKIRVQGMPALSSSNVQITPTGTGKIQCGATNTTVPAGTTDLVVDVTCYNKTQIAAANFTLEITGV